MTPLRIILLLLGVFGAVARPFRLPAWALPLLAVAIEFAVGAVSLDESRMALDPLWAPIGFLLAAVPLAALLDRLGFFSSVAALLTRGQRGVGGLWVLAAVVTALLNLDAAVVLLTPLYVGIARRTGRDPLVLALPTVLLACLASSVLPVSNLTNLIATARTGARSGWFLTNLGLPSLVAVAVGWLAYRKFLLGPAAARRGLAAGGGGLAAGESGLAACEGEGAPASGAEGGYRPGGGAGEAEFSDVVDRRAVLIGGLFMAAVLTGFVVGHSVGVEPWAVALAGDVVLLIILRLMPGGDSSTRGVPWRSVPIGTALVALSLGVLADAAAAHLHVDRLIAGATTADLARTAALSALAANLFNNLPALLIALPALGSHPAPTLWAVLLGVNMGPVLLATGSLASLLWLETLGRLGVKAHPWDFGRAGALVGLPAGVAALAVALAVHAFGWG
jgi:arsenical pump membrane protein